MCGKSTTGNVGEGNKAGGVCGSGIPVATSLSTLRFSVPVGGAVELDDFRKGLSAAAADDLTVGLVGSAILLEEQKGVVVVALPKALLWLSKVGVVTVDVEGEALLWLLSWLFNDCLAS